MLFLTLNSKGEANILSLRFKPMTLTIAKMDRRGCDRMVIGFITTYAFSAYHLDTCISYKWLSVMVVNATVSFIGIGNRSTRRKSLTCRKSLTTLLHNVLFLLDCEVLIEASLISNIY
jgi:hypothetical protein